MRRTQDPNGEGLAKTLGRFGIRVNADGTRRDCR